jgi:hypothetical protein
MRVTTPLPPYCVYAGTQQGSAIRVDVSGQMVIVKTVAADTGAAAALHVSAAGNVTEGPVLKMEICLCVLETLSICLRFSHLRLVSRPRNC